MILLWSSIHLCLSLSRALLLLLACPMCIQLLLSALPPARSLSFLPLSLPLTPTVAATTAAASSLFPGHTMRDVTILKRTDHT